MLLSDGVPLFHNSFKVLAGVSQGGVLSPILFSIFIDSVILNYVQVDMVLVLVHTILAAYYMQMILCLLLTLCMLCN